MGCNTIEVLHPVLSLEMYFPLFSFPGTETDQPKHWQDFKPAGKHVEYQNQFGKGTVSGKVSDWTDNIKTRSDVVEAGCHS